MEKDSVVQLTLKLYRLTLLFPKKEPLRYKTREVADDILKNITILDGLNNNSDKPENARKREVDDLSSEIKEDLDVLCSYFEVAKFQNWLNYFEFLEVQNEYAKIAENLKDYLSVRTEATNPLFPATEEDKQKEYIFSNISENKKIGAINPVRDLFLNGVKLSEHLNDRQQKILEAMSNKEKMQVWELKKIFPDVTKRTIRRDFEYLLNQGFVERRGESNNTFYQLKNRT